MFLPRAILSMPPPSARHRLSRWFSFLILTALCPAVTALPPSAPSAGRQWGPTLYGNPATNPYGSRNADPTTLHSWHLSWTDNADDEDGYLVRVRYGSAGPFFIYGALPANSTRFTFSRENPLDQNRVTYPVQFQIEAWKHNGGRIESSLLTFPNPALTLPRMTDASNQPLPRTFLPPAAAGSIINAAATVRFKLASNSIRVIAPVGVVQQTYRNPPTVVITGSLTNNNASATATLSNGGVVNAITVTQAGGGYSASSPPQFALQAPPEDIDIPGTAPTLALQDQTLLIESVAVTNPGSGYLTPPAIQISSSSGSGAELTPTMQGTTIASINVLQSGSNYSLNTRLDFAPRLQVAMARRTIGGQERNDDGRVVLTWRDVSNSELAHLVQLREIKAGMSESDWISISPDLVPMDSTSVTLSNLIYQINTSQRIKLTPGRPYQFSVRALRIGNDATQPLLSSPDPTAFVMPELIAPSGLLSPEPDSEDSIVLEWTDNSNNETGYQIEYRTGENAYTKHPTIYPENSTSARIGLPPGGSYEFRINAVHVVTKSDGTTETLTSPFTGETIRKSPKTFAAPTNLQAVATRARHSGIRLTWKDESTAEGGFDILACPTGTNQFRFCRAVRANVTEVEVDSIATDVTSPDQRPETTNFTPLNTQVTYDFVVRAVSADELSKTANSNVASAKPMPGFSMKRFYAQAQVGSPFVYQVITDPAANRSQWSVTGLPQGLQFEADTGLIVGTPTQAGLFQPQANASFNEGSETATATLALRILEANTEPVVIKPLPGRLTLSPGKSLDLDLTTFFRDPDTSRAAKLRTTLGDLNLRLFPELAPQAVENFMGYVSRGLYNNVVFHRSIDNFVIQAGSRVAASYSTQAFETIGKLPSPRNEPGLSNLRGTISAAKIGGRDSLYTGANNTTMSRGEAHGYVGLPDSASNDFFLNLSDNSDNLDHQNGGFTVYGQLAASSLMVMDQIAARPTATYGRDDPAERNKPILDFRLATFADFPMDAATAPTEIDNRLAIRIVDATATSPLVARVSSSVPAVCEASIQGARLIISAKGEGTANLSLEIEDLDGRAAVGSPFSIAVEVTSNFTAPSITRQPLPLVVGPTQNAEFSVIASGGPGLTYQWYRNSVALANETGSKIVLPSSNASRAGSYRVEISAGGQSLSSREASLSIASKPLFAAPLPSSYPTTLIVEAGKPIELELPAEAAPAATFSWTRNARAVTGQTAAKLRITSATLTDAGAYLISARNASGLTVAARPCQVVVVDRSARAQTIAAGKSTSLTCAAAGNGLLYEWRKLSDDGLTSQVLGGGYAATFSIASASALQDRGRYFCRVSTNDPVAGSMDCGTIDLVVTSERPVISSASLPDGYIGNPYTHRLAAGNAGTAFAASGLPPGLIINANSGLISGSPTRPGNYQVSLSAANSNGRGPVLKTGLRILPAVSATAGAYQGIVLANETINANKGGRIILTVTDDGTASVNLQLGATTHRVTGKLQLQLDSSTGGILYQCTTPIKTTQGDVILLLQFSPGSNRLGGLLRLGEKTASIVGIRNPWTAPDALNNRNSCRFATPNGRRYNFGITTNPVESPTKPLPRGHGYASITVNSSGLCTLSGRLADGSALTAGISMGPNGEMLIFQMLYGSTGSLLCSLAPVSARNANNAQATLNYVLIQGPARWIRDTQTTANPLYPQGFGPLDLTVQGWLYPSNETYGDLLKSLPNVADNARLRVESPELDALVPPPIKPDLSLRLSARGDVTLPANNPTGLSLKLDASTGAFSGGFQLGIGSTRVIHSYQGLIIPQFTKIEGLNSFNLEGMQVGAQQGQEPVQSRGLGYWLSNALINQRSISAAVSLSAPTLQITQQPQSRTVNPDTSVTFSVTASGGYESAATVTYQWRRNGVDLAGQTSSSMTLPRVSSADAGAYDCLVTRGYKSEAVNQVPAIDLRDQSIAISQSAMLSVNQVVSGIRILQSPPQTFGLRQNVPTSNPLPTGSRVELSAECQGTTPLTYQWKLNGAPLPNATQRTYEIPSLNNDSAGAYSVTISNVASPEGVTSSTHNLTHSLGIGSVSMTRTPPDRWVVAGTRVTYTATATGTDPSYQWLHNGKAIAGATGPTYELTMSSRDQGAYEVSVSSPSTRNPVRSTPDLIHQVTGLTKFEIIRISGAGNTVNLGDEIVLGLDILPTPPANANYSYQWLKNGNPLIDATGPTLPIIASAPPNPQTPDIYRCRLSGGALPASGVTSNAYSYSINQTLTIVASTPAYTPGQTLVLTAQSPQAFQSYQWSRNDDTIPFETLNTISLAPLGPSHRGVYKVTAISGMDGSRTATFELKAVTELGSQGISPKNGQIQRGDTAHFSVSHDGDPNFIYDWRWRAVGTDASGAVHGSTSNTQEIYTSSMAPGEYILEVGVRNAFNDAEVVFQTQFTIESPP